MPFPACSGPPELFSVTCPTRAPLGLQGSANARHWQKLKRERMRVFSLSSPSGSHTCWAAFSPEHSRGCQLGSEKHSLSFPFRWWRVPLVTGRAASLSLAALFNPDKHNQDLREVLPKGSIYPGLVQCFQHFPTTSDYLFSSWWTWQWIEFRLKININLADMSGINLKPLQSYYSNVGNSEERRGGMVAVESMCSGEGRNL